MIVHHILNYFTFWLLQLQSFISFGALTSYWFVWVLLKVYVSGEYYIIHCNSNLTTLQSCCLNHTLAMLILVLQRYPNTSLQCWLHRHMVSCCNGLFMVWFHRLFNDCLQTYLLVWWVCSSQCWGPVKNGKKMIFCNFFHLFYILNILFGFFFFS